MSRDNPDSLKGINQLVVVMGSKITLKVTIIVNEQIIITNFSAEVKHSVINYRHMKVCN